MELAGRVALVTGGGSGMGRATVERLAADGMRVCAVDLDAAAAAEVADRVGAFSIGCDVSDPAQVEAAFAACVERFGAVDLAFLNAGVGLRWSGDIGELDLDQYRLSVGVNLDGVVYGVREAVRTMRAHSAGQDCAIVATASIAGVIPFHPDPVYTIGKHGVVGLIRSIAPNLAAERIACHAILPGTTATGMVPQEFRGVLAKMEVPLQGPEAIGEAVVVAATAPLDQAGTCWVAAAGEAPWPFEFAGYDGADSKLNVHR